MRPFLIALGLVFCAPAVAFAGCVSRPDTAASSYLQNQQSLALCQADELADDVRALQRRVDIDTQLRALGDQMRLNQQAIRAQQAQPML